MRLSHPDLTPPFRWYEVYTMIRRLMLTSVPAMFSTISTETLWTIAVFLPETMQNDSTEKLKHRTHGTSIVKSSVLIITLGLRSVLTLIFERECQPYCDGYISAFSYLLHWQILLVVLYLLLLDSEATLAAGCRRLYLVRDSF